jgi:hypothetical protein
LTCESAIGYAHCALSIRHAHHLHHFHCGHGPAERT